MDMSSVANVAIGIIIVLVIVGGLSFAIFDFWMRFKEKYDKKKE